MKFIKLKIISEKNIVYDLENKIYKVLALPAKCKLLINGENSFPTGWFLIRGRIKRKGKSLKVKLIFNSNNNQNEQYIPVSCKGTILELIKIPPKTKEIFLELVGSGEFVIADDFYLKPVSNLERIYRMFRRVFSYFQKRFDYQRKTIGLSYYIPFIDLQKSYELANKIRDCDAEVDYLKWAGNIDKLTQKDIEKIIKDLKRSRLDVKFYILIYDDNDHIKLNKTLSSLEKQLYRNFEIKILNDKSKTEFKNLINLSLENTYFIFLKSGTVLPPHSLYWMAKEAEISDLDFLYTDHDYIDFENKRFSPCFKPDFSLEYLRATNYINLAFAVKAKALSKIEDLDIEEIYEHNSYSLNLKIAEKTDLDKMRHIPSILFHFPEEMKNKEILSDKNPVKEHLERLKVSASVQRVDSKNYKVIYHLKDSPFISIIISTRDKVLILKNCIESILSKSTYSNYEIILIDNQSREEDTLKYLRSLSNMPRIKLLSYNKPFNFSAINNLAVTEAKGEVLVFLNNDTEVITSNWLEIMLGCLQQPKVGAVGAKLYYPSGQIQHAGVIIGLGGCADHAFKGLDKKERGYMDRAILQQEYSAVTAACMMTWRNLFIEVGGFDEKNLPISFNDVDYCLKLREAGYRIIFTPYVEFYHYESLSRGEDLSVEAQRRSKREVDYIRKKWKKYIDYDPFYNPNLSYERLDFSLNPFPKIKKPWIKNEL